MMEVLSTPYPLLTALLSHLLPIVTLTCEISFEQKGLWLKKGLKTTSGLAISIQIVCEPH